MLEIATIATIAALLLLIIGSGMTLDFAPQLAGFERDVREPIDKPWEKLLMFKKGGAKAPPVDPNVGIAAAAEAKNGADWLAFSKEQFADSKVRQAKVDAIDLEVTNEQRAAAKESAANSREQWNRYNTVFKPVEDRVVKDANEWDSAERQERMAAEAKTDVVSNALAAKESGQRQMASMGVDPRSGRFDANDRATDLNVALASAGAENNARSQVRTQGAAMREGVANMGRGATSTAAQQLGLGLQAGNSAMSNTLATEANWRANQGQMNQGFAGNQAGLQGSANAYLGINSANQASANSQNAAAAANGQETGALVGTAVMAGAMVF
jgi:hypothetical protein